MSAMKFCIPLFTVFLAVFCGCDRRHFIAGHDDVGQFILKTAEQFGGTPTATNGLPRISDQWSYFEESNRVVIKLSNQTFPAVVEFLHQSFGKPTGTGDSYRYYEYQLQLTTKGAILSNGVYNGAVLYLQEGDKDTEVIIQSHPEPNFSMLLPNMRIGCKSHTVCFLRLVPLRRTGNQGVGSR